ncbi:hypothetical protein JHC09_07565 [Devosia sp. MC532]|uniref:hypothetical protein n=1 Tax=Devosia sp. MC532 TaxID=2799788 RepID=UPI0018F50320|nr:hypothetical protein [Devosia sp. MC532]MBJ7577744.1 hypothetical protein [Devosia sp. MC532]
MSFTRLAFLAFSLTATVTTSAYAAAYSHEDFGSSVETFAAGHADILGATLISSQQRLARLVGGSTDTGLTQGEMLSYIASTSPSAAATAAAVQAATPSYNPFAAWVDGSFSYLESNKGSGRAVLGAAGVDYRVNSSLLVGAFVSIDKLNEFKTEYGTVDGYGVMVGPYITARLTEQLSLDVTAAVGAAKYTSQVPFGGLDATTDATRAYFNATLNGVFGEDSIRFTPRAGLTHAAEWTNGYTDGGYIAGETYSKTVVFAGPGVTLAHTANGITSSASLNADLKSTLGDKAQLSGAIEAATKLEFANGFGLGASASYSGIGTSDRSLSLSLKASASF